MHEGGLSWCWDRVSGRKSKVMDYPRVHQTKRKKIPKNGFLQFHYFSFFPFGSKKERG